MQKILLAPFVLVFTINVPIVKADTSKALRICEYVQANDKQRLRKFLKIEKLKLRDIFSDIRCNQDNLMVFAAKSKALDVGDFIIGKLPSKVVAEEVENIATYSPHLATVAKERIN